jgi:hypothetical protein
VLSTTCLQFNPLDPPVLLNAASKLGHAGFTEPATAAAARARRVGRYKLSAVRER